MKNLSRKGGKRNYNSFRVVFLAGVVIGYVQFQPTARASQKTNAPSTAPTIAQAVRVERAPRLDGTLNDPLWQTAKPISDFHQREPHEGQAPMEKTEVRIL